MSDLNQAIALDAKIADAWSHRAVVWFVRQDYSRAIADFDEALKINPQLTDVYCSRGVVWLTLGKLIEAEKDFAHCRAAGGQLMPGAEQLLQETRKRLQ